jgi:Putative Ig domain
MKLASPCLLLLALVAPCMGIQIPTTALPNGIISSGYYGVILVSGGCAPYTWSVVSGSLPPGLSMKTSKGTSALGLYGRPTKAATFTFEVSARGCGGNVANASFTVVVQSAPNHVVDLSWVASKTKDVVGYNVYRGADGEYWRRINSGLNASTSYSDSTVADRTVYYYATTAVDVNGHESQKSNIVKSTIP